MVIVDTNVLSEVLLPAPDDRVRLWIGAHSGSDLFTTAITLAEMHYGVELVPTRKRRSELQAGIDRLFEEFDDRVLPFDAAAGLEFALILASRRRSGRPIREVDAQIAAIARSHGAAVATRNMDDFANCGVELINRWAG